MREIEGHGPASHFFTSQRLRLHYVDWGKGNGGNASTPPVVLVHGGRDHARSWDWVARDLSRDFHVIAPDLRGHGDSAWAIGSLYHAGEFVIDLAQLIDAIGHDQVTLIAHSMGASVCAQYAGANPERVAGFFAIEGIDVPFRVAKAMGVLTARQRVANAIASAQKQAGQQKQRYATLDDAANRMQEANSFLSPAQALHLTQHGVDRNEDSTFSWKFDDYARWPKFLNTPKGDIDELVSEIECPVLLVRGTEGEVPDPAESGLLQRIPNARAVAVEGAGHWVHHDRLDETLRLMRSFLEDPATDVRSRD